MNQPDPNCPECHGDPRGVLGLNDYSPCKKCNDLPMSGFEKDRATHKLAEELERVASRPRTAPDDENKRRM